ncbi:hypothetical protein AWB71_03289 [Caballeronia peredens]|nr:hypothetical protein AWB71_03289 [Caballeronia peredens]
MAKSDDKADVWMPLYIGDYLADTNRLTTEQHGAYLLLIMDYWRNGPPPDDEEILQNVTRLSKFLWKKHGPVLQKFFTVENGVWRHKRIDEEMAGAASGKAAASEKARIAANARWGKADAQSIAQAHAPSMLEECPSQSPSPTPNKPKAAHQVFEAGGESDRGNALPEIQSNLTEEQKALIPVVKALRTAGVAVMAANPLVAEWAAKGLTAERVPELIEFLRARGKTGNIHPNYLNTVIDDALNPPAPKAVKPRADDWFRSPKGIERKASELGIYARPGESHDALRERCDSELRRREQQGVAA